MSRNSLPDLLGLSQLQENDNPPVPRRFVLDIRGDVEVEDNVVTKRVDLRIGPIAIIRPPAITANQANYNPLGFGWCSVVMLTATLSGARVSPTEDPAEIRTLRRVWINVGSVPIELFTDSTPRLLLPNESVMTAYEPAEELWRMQEFVAPE